jgi:small-conductance mechanosensitive channel
MDTSSTDGRSGRLGIAACIAAFLLGGAHLIVNTLDFVTQGRPTAASLGVYAVYVLGVVALCAFLGLAALALSRHGWPRLSRRALRGIVWAGAVLVTLLAVLTIYQAVAARDIGRMTFAGPGPWTTLCGPLLGLVAWRSGHGAG